MGQNAREIRPEQTVENKKAGDDHQRPAYGSTRGLQNQNDGENPHDEIQAGGVADPLDEVFIKESHIDGRDPRHHRQGEIYVRNALTL